MADPQAVANQGDNVNYAPPAGNVDITPQATAALARGKAAAAAQQQAAEAFLDQLDQSTAGYIQPGGWAAQSS